jgi:hypothetical protein
MNSTKRGRRRRSYREDDGEIRIYRERANTVEVVLGTLKQRCMDLDVNETEANELYSSLSDALTCIVGKESPEEEDVLPVVEDISTSYGTTEQAVLQLRRQALTSFVTTA